MRKKSRVVILRSALFLVSTCLILALTVHEAANPAPANGSFPAECAALVGTSSGCAASEKPLIDGPASFTIAVREALLYLDSVNRDDYQFVSSQISLITVGFEKNVVVNVNDGTVVFPEEWDYNRYGRIELMERLICEATHIWLSRNNYRFYGEEAERYRIEQKVHRYILLN